MQFTVARTTTDLGTISKACPLAGIPTASDFSVHSLLRDQFSQFGSVLRRFADHNLPEG